MENKLKLVVVGDSFTGKTSLLIAYTQKKFLENYSTTVFDNWSLSIQIDHKTYSVNLFDTAGQEDYEHIRCLSYPHTNVFLLCFSLVDRKSLDCCRTSWMPEIRKYAGDSIPVFLIGTKQDLVEKTDPKLVVSEDHARKIASEIGCYKFLSCSALTHRGLKKVFDECFLVAVGEKLSDESPKPCCILL